MAYTKEQIDSLNKINQQFQTKYGDNAQNEFQNYVTKNYGADKLQEIKTNLSGNVAQQQADTTFTQNQNRQKELEGLIKSGQGSASVNAEYNRLTGNNQGARDVMLGSTEAQKTMKTTITPEEAGQIVQSGVTDIGEGVKPDMTAWTKEDFKQAMDTTKVTKQETPTGTITTTETPKGTTKIETIDQFKQAGGGLSNLEQLVENRYGTIATQEADGSLTATINGEKFKWSIDASGNPVKTSLGKVDQQTITPDMIYQSILLGQSVDKNTPGYNDAKKRYDAYNMYSTMTDAQLSASIGKGNILPGTTVYEDLMKDPLQKARIEKIQKYNLITGNTPKTEDVFTNKSEEIANNTKVNIEGQDMTLAQAIEDGYISENEINSLTNNSEIITKAKEVENLKNEYDSALAIYNNIERDLKEQWKGTGATKTDIAVAVANAREKLLPGLQELESRTNNAIGTLTQMKADSAQLFATNLGLYQQQQQREQQLQDITSQREYQTAQDIKNFEQQKEIMKLQQDYQNANITTSTITDSATGKISLINSKTGETIKTFNTGLAPTKTTGTQDWAKLSDGSLYNQRTGEVKAIGVGGTTTTTGASGVLQTYKQGNKTITLDSNAGTALNNVLAKIPNAIIGSTLRTSEEQQKLYDAYKSGKGGLAAKPGTSLHEKGLAVDIYSGTDKNGKLLAPDANLVAEMNANGWFQTAGPADKGHFEFKGVQGGGGGQTNYSQQADAWANNIMNGKAKLSDLTGKENIPLKNQVIQIMNQKSGGSTGKTQDNLELGLQIVSSLINHPGRQSATGVPNFFTNPFGYALPTSNARDFQATLKQFSDLQFLNAIPQMQGMGALSNAEGLKLSGALTKLQDTGISEEDFLKELNRVKEVMNKAYKNITGNDYGQVDTTGTSTQYGGKVYNFNPQG